MKKLLFATAAFAFAASAGVAMAHDDDGDYRDNGYQHQWDRGEHQRNRRDYAERDNWRGGYDQGYQGYHGERRDAWRGHRWNRYHYRVYRGGYSENPYAYAYPSGYGQSYGYSWDGGY